VKEFPSSNLIQCCPNCGSEDIHSFYQLSQIPVHSVQLLETREEAVEYPKGNIDLALCHACGFITNRAFQPEVHDYSSKYEATQGYSATFNTFHQRLAQSLIDQYDLHGKTILEIGCGQGEFLELLCQLGGNQGIGFDPAYSIERTRVTAKDGITFVQDFYSEIYTNIHADFICCKMTLEHIHQTADFIRTIRQSIGSKTDTVTFFQVPNGKYVFGDTAFWDIYYEHCSYFSKSSLAHVFRHSGFQVSNLWTDYDDQYLMIEAHPVTGIVDQRPLPNEESAEDIAEVINGFVVEYAKKEAAWKNWIQNKKDNGQKIVLWGGGSKGVAFLTTLGIGLDQIEYVVDINPHKSGTFMAGTGQEIVQPGYLRLYRPDAVVVMNPVYWREIQENLAIMDLYPEIVPISSL
jgi:2-polyprenyl-3-methyl-5-hydroxy-6-metoxy-1,4-benzoquinol methylase